MADDVTRSICGSIKNIVIRVQAWRIECATIAKRKNNTTGKNCQDIWVSYCVLNFCEYTAAASLACMNFFWLLIKIRNPEATYVTQLTT